MDALVTLLLKELPSGELACVVEECAGVDAPAGIPAPLSEGVRLDIRLENADARALLLVHQLIRGQLPLVVRVLPAAVGHEPTERLVVLSGEPGDADGAELGRVVHEAAP